MANLTEIDAKGLLGRYGVPVTKPVLSRSADEAVAAAKACGGPIAMKVSSPDIPHKSSIGGVRLNVNTDEVARAFEQIWAAGVKVPGARVDGVIVESMAAAGLEVILGATRDPLFGPVVMFGLGGKDVERRHAVDFRLAPLTEKDARSLVAYVCDAASIDNASREALVSIILAVGGSEGVLFREPLIELDINPLIVSDMGVVAVDAHMKVDPDGTLMAIEQPRVSAVVDDYHPLKAIFEPEGIVVVGASTRPDKLGFVIVRNLVDYGFRGPLYAVHPAANNIYGCPCFPSVEDLPECVDRAIVAVAAVDVPDALRACAARGVRVAQVYSAGFSEWSDEGRNYEARIREVVAETGLRVIGPNTIGTFSSSGGMTLTVPRYSPKQPGSISFIGQSGNYVLDVISRSEVMGLPLGKSLSCGNCVDLGAVDYLALLADDARTEIIGMYLESVAEAGRFFRFASTISKPLVLMKGGRTAAGLKAASSHTGALATDMVLWTAAARQAGAIVVESIDDMLDVFMSLVAYDGRASGSGVALFTSGGGISVGAADCAAAAGLRMVQLDKRTARALERFGVPGTSVKNPIDIPVWGLKSKGRFIFDEMIETLASDAAVGSVIACVEMGSVFSFSADEKSGLEQMELIAESIQAANSPVPVSVVFRTTGDRVQDDFLRAVRPRMLARGIAVFPTVDRAIRSHAAIAAAMDTCRATQQPD